MENKEMKKTIPAELNDDALNNVSGGTGEVATSDIPVADLGLLPGFGATNREN